MSPIKGSVEDLSKISIFIGTHDIFEPDVPLFKSKLKAHGIEFNDYVYPAMMHIWRYIEFINHEYGDQQ